MASPFPRKEPSKEPRWTRRKDARPEELTAAALELFVERGYAATRLEDVAARAGVSKGTVYLYFANKEELFKAVVRAGLVTPLNEAREFVQTYEGSMSELLGILLRRWWDSVCGTAVCGLPKLVIAESKNFPEIARFYLEEVIEPGHRTVQDILAKGVARGEFKADDAVTSGFLVVAPMVFLSIWQHSFGAMRPDAFDPSRFVDAHIELLRRGLSKDGPCSA